MYDVIVIGGGASGMTSAIVASKRGLKVAIIEKNNSLGKKILVTGAGKCNFFNDDFNYEHYVSDNNTFLKEIINDYNIKKVKEFFNSLGIIYKVKDGYYYPASKEAISIQNSFISEIKELNIEVYNNTNLIDVDYINNTYIIKTNENIYRAKNIILCTGTRAFYDTNESDIGYQVAFKYNHKIVKVLPGLVQLKLEGNYLKDWSGIRLDVSLSLYEDNNIIKKEVGEAQLTNYGISGICTLQLSNIAVRMLDNKKKPYLKINFLNNLGINTKEDFINYFKKRNNLFKNKNISELFDTILNYKLTNLILKIAKIDSHKNFNELDNNELDRLYTNLVEFKTNIIGHNSYKEAQICIGGVSLDDINNNMESKKQKGLYMCGELLDVSGDCGGYNLGFAFISGLLAGNSVGDNND